MSRTFLKLSLALALAPAAFGQSRVDERRPAAADGLVQIENAAGSIRVVGWSREEVQVTGTLGARADGLEFVSRAGRTRIHIEVDGNPNRVVSDLEIRVPAGSRLQIESYSATIEIADVTGRVKAESVSGAISVAGTPSEVEVESVSGVLSITGATRRVRASAVNAGITIRGASGVVSAETVNGRLEVAGGSFQEARLETVNGALRFDGDLPSSATLEIETVNGTVDLRLPAKLGADFTISTFNGEVESDFEMQLLPGSRRGGQRTGGQRADPGKHKDKDDEHDHDDKETELRFTTGGGGAKIAITTLNGRVTLRKR